MSKQELQKGMHILDSRLPITEFETFLRNTDLTVEEMTDLILPATHMHTTSHLKALLALGVRDVRDETLETVLETGFYDAAICLIKNGSNPRCEDDYPLERAVWAGEVGLLKTVLESTEIEATKLHEVAETAITEDEIDVYRYLLEHLASPHTKTQNQSIIDTLLIHAATINNLCAVRATLAVGANINVSNGMALICTFQNGEDTESIQLVEHLIDAGIDITINNHHILRSALLSPNASQTLQALIVQYEQNNKLDIVSSIVNQIPNSDYNPQIDIAKAMVLSTTLLNQNEMAEAETPQALNMDYELATKIL